MFRHQRGGGGGDHSSLLRLDSHRKDKLQQQKAYRLEFPFNSKCMPSTAKMNEQGVWAHQQLAHGHLRHGTWSGVFRSSELGSFASQSPIPSAFADRQ